MVRFKAFLNGLFAYYFPVSNFTTGHTIIPAVEVTPKLAYHEEPLSEAIHEEPLAAPIHEEPLPRLGHTSQHQYLYQQPSLHIASSIHGEPLYGRHASATARSVLVAKPSGYEVDSNFAPALSEPLMANAYADDNHDEDVTASLKSALNDYVPDDYAPPHAPEYGLRLVAPRAPTYGAESLPTKSPYSELN